MQLHYSTAANKVISLVRRTVLDNVFNDVCDLVNPSNVNYRSVGRFGDEVNNVASKFSTLFQWFDNEFYVLFDKQFDSRFVSFVHSLHSKFDNRCWNVLSFVAKGFLEDLFEQVCCSPEVEHGSFEDVLSKFEHSYEEGVIRFHQFDGYLFEKFDTDNVLKTFDDKFVGTLHERVLTVDDVVHQMKFVNQLEYWLNNVSKGFTVDNCFDLIDQKGFDEFANALRFAVFEPLNVSGFFLGVNDNQRLKDVDEFVNIIVDLFKSYDFPMLYTVVSRLFKGLVFEVTKVHRLHSQFYKNVPIDLFKEFMCSHVLFECSAVENGYNKCYFEGLEGYLLVPDQAFYDHNKW